jgi:hypothetical protein
MRAGWLAAALWSSGCGGGLFVGWSGGGDNTPPSVNLTSAATSALAGQPVRFVAAASDENGVERVAFFRVDPDGTTLLGTDFSTPYEWTATAPADGRATLAVFARAVDFEGNAADSPTVSVTITRP